MTLTTVHALLYVAANCLLVLVWVMAGGRAGALGGPLRAAREEGFWPFWVAAGWGVLLALHVALTVVITLGVRRRRRRKRRAVRGASTRGRGWIAAMFTDIADSTALSSGLGDQAYSDLLTAHRRSVREVVAEHDGTEVGTQGDGFLLRFEAPGDAVACAVALQRRLADERRRDGATPHVRVGIHAGEVVIRDGDMIGRMVNLAARVADEAGPDEVVVTEPVADHAGADIELDDLGLRTLRGAPTPRHLLAVGWDRG